MSRLIEIPLLKTNGLGNVLSTMGGGGSGGGIPGPTGPTGDAGSKSTYVYAPNYVDTLPVGTYVSWEALMEEISHHLGTKTIYFDGRITLTGSTSSIIIPAPSVTGTIYQLKDVIFSNDFTIDNGVPPAALDVFIDDGVLMNNLSNIDGFINLVYTGVEPCMIADGGSSPNSAAATLSLDNGARISSSSGPLIRVDGFFVIAMGDNSWIGDPTSTYTSPCIQVSNGASAVVYRFGVGPVTGIQTDAFDSTGALAPSM